MDLCEHFCNVCLTFNLDQSQMPRRWSLYFYFIKLFTVLPLKPGRLQHCLFWFWSGQFLRSIWTLSTPRSVYPCLHHLICLSVYLSVSHFPFFCPSLACILFLWLQTPGRFMFSPPFFPTRKDSQQRNFSRQFISKPNGFLFQQVGDKHCVSGRNVSGWGEILGQIQCWFFKAALHPICFISSLSLDCLQFWKWSERGCHTHFSVDAHQGETHLTVVLAHIFGCISCQECHILMLTEWYALGSCAHTHP